MSPSVTPEYAMCVRAPCPALYYLRTEKGSLAISRKASSQNALTVLDNMVEGTKVCISGQYQDTQKSVIGAAYIEPANF